MKILVIDDEPAVLKMYQLALAAAGHTVLTARDGVEGLAMIKKSHPDLVFLDIIMPNMNGFDVLADAKKDADIKDIPIYMLTNLPESASGAKARQLGATGYLVKAEIEPTTLTKIIDQLTQK